MGFGIGLMEIVHRDVAAVLARTTLLPLQSSERALAATAYLPEPQPDLLAP